MAQLCKEGNLPSSRGQHSGLRCIPVTASPHCCCRRLPAALHAPVMHLYWPLSASPSPLLPNCCACPPILLITLQVHACLKCRDCGRAAVLPHPGRLLDARGAGAQDRGAGGAVRMGCLALESVEWLELEAGNAGHPCNCKPGVGWPAAGLFQSEWVRCTMLVFTLGTPALLAPHPPAASCPRWSGTWTAC